MTKKKWIILAAMAVLGSVSGVVLSNALLGVF
jgi:hypothetical protein